MRATSAARLAASGQSFAPAARVTTSAGSGSARAGEPSSAASAKTPANAGSARTTTLGFPIARLAAHVGIVNRSRFDAVRAREIASSVIDGELNQRSALEAARAGAELAGARRTVAAARAVDRVLLSTVHQLRLHRYRHARWTGSRWDDRQLVPAGPFFVEDGGEKQYSGGISFDHADPNVVYLSRQVKGQFEVERRTTADGGLTWTTEPLTARSAEKNVRPVVARNGGPLWMRGAYLNYTHYRTAIVTS